MPTIDWHLLDEPPPERLIPGVYLARISKSEERVTKNGDPYFNVAMEAVDFGNRFLCYDNINLGGKGARMGLSKLAALGLKGRAEVDATELIGLQAYVLVEDEPMPGGKTRRVIPPNWSHDCLAGYWAENPGPPPDVPVETPLRQPEPPLADDPAATPF